MFKASFKVTKPDGGQFVHVVHNLDTPNKKAAESKARRVLKKYLPSCRFRLRGVYNQTGGVK